MKHQFFLKICWMILILFLASCSKEDSSATPALPPNTVAPSRTELSVVVQHWQYYGGNTYVSNFTNLISSLNTSNGKVSVYAEVDGAYKKISEQPIDYYGGMLSASVSQTDLSVTYHLNQVGAPPQNLTIKLVVEK